MKLLSYIAQERVDALNRRKSPIIDQELSQYLANEQLNLSASTDLDTSVKMLDYVVISLRQLITTRKQTFLIHLR